MYRIKCEKEFDFPLEVASFAERYNALIQEDNKKKIVYIKNEFDNSTFRYRCYNITQTLANSNKYCITYFNGNEIKKIIDNLEKVSMIIFQRASFNIEIINLITYARKNNICIVYDIDDLFYKAEHATNYINHLGYEYDEDTVRLYLGIVSSYNLVAKECDYYIATTEYLKNRIITDFKKPCFLIKNFLNKEQIAESEYILKNREYDQDKFIIGYFSGSGSHNNDFITIEQEIHDLMNKYNNIYLKIVGFMKLGSLYDQFKKDGRVIMKQLVPYQELQYEIGEVDINVVPLAESEFSKAKSELKFFEAGLLKIPSCVSENNVFNEFIDNYKNGILCKEGTWKSNIERIYLDKKLLKEIGENAYKTTCQIYVPTKQQQNIETVYDKILKQHNT